jgi:peptide/nickel transport system substrate-binding protein
MRSPHRTLVALAATLGLVLAACGSTNGGSATGSSSGGGGSSGSAATTDVQLAYNADMQVPDPDIFYEIEGNSITTSVYEGLVRYKPNSSEIEPALAEKYSVSDDGLTYTFNIRPGVKFHDGTALDAAAAQASFERRTNVNSAPAYMLADVDSYSEPDPMTFVIKLKNPVSPFFDYLAAPYGPKMVSPTVLKDQAGSDFAQSYLKDHDAGTGPFTITEFDLGTKYKTTRFDGYWGPKPQVTSITYNILPDISTQRLKLESGELSMIIHGLSASDVTSFESNPGFQVQRFPALFKTLMMVNPNKDAFKDKAARQAVVAAIDKEKIAKEVYGDNGTLATQIYPAGELPEGMAKEAPKDPSKLAAMAGQFSGKTIDIGYSSDDARNQKVADLVQTDLQAAGLTATTRGIPIAQVFDLPKNKDTAPDLLLSTVNPDAAHPDTWARIFMSTDGALNWLQCSVPEADTQLDAGLRSTDKTVIQTSYAKAGDLFVDSGCFSSIADVKEVIVAKKGYGSFVHQLPTLFTVRFGDLTVG